MNERQGQMQRAERAKGIIQKIECRITDLMCLSNGDIMSGSLFRAMLKEHPDMEARLDILQR